MNKKNSDRLSDLEYLCEAALYISRALKLLLGLYSNPGQESQVRFTIPIGYRLIYGLVNTGDTQPQHEFIYSNMT